MTLVRVRALSRLPFLRQRPDRLVRLDYVSVESGRKTACSDHFRFKSRVFFFLFLKAQAAFFNTPASPFQVDAAISHIG